MSYSHPNPFTEAVSARLDRRTTSKMHPSLVSVERMRHLKTHWLDDVLRHWLHRSLSPTSHSIMAPKPRLDQELLIADKLESYSPAKINLGNANGEILASRFDSNNTDKYSSASCTTDQIIGRSCDLARNIRIQRNRRLDECSLPSTNTDYLRPVFTRSFRTKLFFV